MTDRAHDAGLAAFWIAFALIAAIVVNLIGINRALGAGRCIASVVAPL